MQVHEVIDILPPTNSDTALKSWAETLKIDPHAQFTARGGGLVLEALRVRGPGRGRTEKGPTEEAVVSMEANVEEAKEAAGSGDGEQGKEGKEGKGEEARSGGRSRDQDRVDVSRLLVMDMEEEAGVVRV